MQHLVLSRPHNSFLSCNLLPSFLLNLVFLSILKCAYSLSKFSTKFQAFRSSPIEFNIFPNHLKGLCYHFVFFHSNYARIQNMFFAFQKFNLDS